MSILLKILTRYIPLNIGKVPSGSKVFDWTVPQEWEINDAFLLSPVGEKILDFKKNNLQDLNYSTPINTEIELEDLQNNNTSKSPIQ